MSTSDKKAAAWRAWHQGYDAWRASLPPEEPVPGTHLRGRRLRPEDVSGAASLIRQLAKLLTREQNDTFGESFYSLHVAEDGPMAGSVGALEALVQNARLMEWGIPRMLDAEGEILQAARTGVRPVLSEDGQALTQNMFDNAQSVADDEAAKAAVGAVSQSTARRWGDVARVTRPASDEEVH